MGKNYSKQNDCMRENAEYVGNDGVVTTRQPDDNQKPVNRKTRQEIRDALIKRVEHVKKVHDDIAVLKKQWKNKNKIKVYETTNGWCGPHENDTAEDEELETLTTKIDDNRKAILEVQDAIRTLCAQVRFLVRCPGASKNIFLDGPLKLRFISHPQTPPSHLLFEPFNFQ